MDLLPTPEQEEIANTVTTVLSDLFPVTGLEQFDEAIPTVDADTWARIGELGWFGLGLDEASGGVGYGLAEEALLFEQLGIHVTPGGFLAQVMAAHLAAASGNDTGEFVSGASRAAWGEATSASNSDGETVSLLVLDLDGATHVVVHRNGALSLVAADALTETEPIPSIDPQVRLHTAAVDAGLLATEADERVTSRATVLHAALCAGLATGTARQSVEYGKDRQQFGQPIGAFQAVKHRCADMATRAEVATSQVRWAALTHDADRPDATAHALAAAITAAGAAVTNAQTNIQNHGGIGFTWEHPAHRFVSRARLLGQLLGGQHRSHTAFLAEPTPA